MNIGDITMNYWDLDWLKSNCTQLHYFGLGFIQLKLTTQFRLHFYTNKLAPIVPDEDIHDHRYSFYSSILKGTLHQKLYEKIAGNKYLLEYESCQEGQCSEIIFECPNSEHRWHLQAIELRQEADKTVSPSLIRLIMSDLAIVVRNKQRMRSL